MSLDSSINELRHFGGRLLGLWYSEFDTSGRTAKGYQASWVENSCES